MGVNTHLLSYLQQSPYGKWLWRYANEIDILWQVDANLKLAMNGGGWMLVLK